MSRMTGLIAATLIATASMVGVASAQHGMDDLSEHSGGHHHGGGGGGSDDPSEHLGK